MKKLVICLVFIFATACYDYDPNYNPSDYQPSGNYCVYDVYQNATVIDTECKSCDIGDHDGNSAYYINTNTTCTP